MPWQIIKADAGFYVETISTKRRHSKEPLTKSKAEAQLKALELNADKPSSLIAKGPINKYRRQPKEDKIDRDINNVIKHITKKRITKRDKEEKKS